LSEAVAGGRIGRYNLIKPLGEGAMAQVWLAELETGIGFRRKVALKVVRQEYAKDPKFVQLMSREAMIGSLLQHPNIVQTLEFNEADGRSFLALEFVEGETFADLLEKRADGGGLPTILALEAMVQVLKGLSYAHTMVSPEGEQLGIVHRDLKPGNIMLSRHGLVKIMDFGIAKAKIATANITTAGQVRGTPIYMAPEQVLGKNLDGRSDQFAACTVLYELLTGKQLFIDNNLIRIMQRVARADVESEIGELAAIHNGLAPIVRRMWARDPADRYGDCNDAASAIEDVVYDLKRSGTVPPSPSPAPVGPPVDSRADTLEVDDKPMPSMFGRLAELARTYLMGGAKDEKKAPAKKKKGGKRKQAADTAAAAAPPKAKANAPKASPAESDETLPIKPPKRAAGPKKPSEPSVDGLDMVFEDASADEDQSGSRDAPQPAPPSIAARARNPDDPPEGPQSIGPPLGEPKKPAADAKAAQPKQAPSADESVSTEDLDPFFFGDFKH
jgi:serine/threonine-protein kinase